MLDVKQKQLVAETARRFMTDKCMSQAALAKYCDVNPSYLSNILNHDFHYRAAGDKTVAIADKYFNSIAAKVGLTILAAFWRTVETPQFIEMIAALEDAKEHAAAKLIIGETGCGKTFTLNKFRAINPRHTFTVTVSSVHTIRDVIEDLARELDIKLVVRKSVRLRRIMETMKRLHAEGKTPLLAIDEAENFTHGIIGLNKAIYDGIFGYCGMAVIGTGHLEDKLDTLERYGREGIPQFRRRFKAGIVRLTKIDRNRDYEAFFEQVQDRGLHTLLRGLCANYGELHDFLEPALRSASQDGVALTDSYFKTMYNIA